jgi:tetratricopeptide (TPR) repeat protein
METSNDGGNYLETNHPISRVTVAIEGNEMKLADALFREPWRAYQVLGEIDDWDNFGGWDLQPLMGPTLAQEDVQGPFQGLFIVAAQLVTGEAAPRRCYLDVVLPERVVEHHFLQIEGRVIRGNGRRALNGTIIPSIAMEVPGVYKLFYAKENPMAGIEVLNRGLQKARRKQDIAYDMGLLLRDEKKYEEALAAFSIFLSENPNEGIADVVYRERSKMYAALGQLDKAEEDKRQYAIAFERKYGHVPGAHEM